MSNVVIIKVVKDVQIKRKGVRSMPNQLKSIKLFAFRCPYCSGPLAAAVKCCPYCGKKIS